MDIIEPFSSPNGTPFKLRGFQPDQSRQFVGAHLCEIRGFQVSTFHFPEFHLLKCYFWRHCRPPRISFGAAEATKDHFGGILSFSDFHRNPKIKKIYFLVFPVTVFDEIQGNRCAIDVWLFSNPRFIQKRCFLLIFASLVSR